MSEVFQADTYVPRSIRNDNPGNIEYNPHIQWRGLCNPPADDKGYCRFESAQKGFRALGIDVYTKWQKDGLRTVRLIITKFAPPSENNTEAYIKDVADHLKVNPDVWLNLDDPEELKTLCRSISIHEAGKWGFSDKDLDDGVGLALAYCRALSADLVAKVGK